MLKLEAEALPGSQHCSPQPEELSDISTDLSGNQPQLPALCREPIHSFVPWEGGGLWVWGVYPSSYEARNIHGKIRESKALSGVESPGR